MPRDVEQMLEASGLQWEVQPGRRHDRLLIQGRMVQILCHGHRREHGRAWDNMRARIRRAIRELMNV